MTPALKTFLFVFCLVISPWSYGQYTLTDSKIDVIEQLTKNYKGKILNLSDLDKIVREISQDGVFQVVYVELLDNNQVVIRAQQSVKLKVININGNTSFQEDEIKEALSIKRGEVLSDLEIVQAVERVKDLYRSSGFFNFKIDYTKSMDEEGLTLKLNIDESDFCIIEDIQVFSKNDKLNTLVDEFVAKTINTSYQKDTSLALEKKLNDLLLKNRYLTAKVQNTGTIFNQNKTRVRLKYTITNAIQHEFVFHGNHFFSHFDLINKSEIGSKFLYLSDSSSEIIETIVDLYLKNGFPQVTVKSSERIFTESNKKVYVFEINEGPRIRIGRIDIVGKISREKSFYKKLFNEFLANEAHTVYFVRKDIENAAEAMVTQLKRQGHLQAELLSLNFEVTKQKTAIITIQIDEGILTYIRQILFRGSKSFSNIELTDEVKIKPNKPLSIEEIEESFSRVEEFYKERGYLEFKIKNRNASVIQYKPGQPYADLVYEISEGPKIYVQSIQVKGLKKTKKYVALREIDFKVGDLLTLSKVTNSIDRLEKTGFFGKVNIRSIEQENRTGKRTIVVELEERKPGLFSSGVGILSEGRIIYRGYVGALYNNLGGKARGVSSRVDLRLQNGIDFLENRVALSYYEPYITESRLRGRVSLIREQRVYDPSQNNPTVLSTNEIRFSTEKEFSKKYRLTYNIWGFSNQESFFAKDKAQRSKELKVQNIATTGPIFEIDYRNDPFLPTDGSYTRLELEYSDPILGSSRDNPSTTGTTAVGEYSRRNDENNEINYYRATFQTTHYIPLTKSKRWVWANSLRGGFLQNISSRNDSGVPQIRSFFLGGTSSIRGFSFGTAETVPGKRELCIKQGLITNGQNTDECRLDDVYVRDNSAFALFKSELRFPISGAFGGLIFYDGGAVVLSGLELEDPYRDSVGFGFSYDTPVGSFILQLGYKLDRKLRQAGSFYDDESDVAIHLAIGTF